jgi:hypothetical protein
VELRPGQADLGLRVLDFRATADGYHLVVEGLTGRDYGVTLLGEPVQSVVGAAAVERAGARTRLNVTIPPSGAATGQISVTLKR